MEVAETGWTIVRWKQGGIVVRSWLLDGRILRAGLEGNEGCKARVQAKTSTDRLERWLSFLSRRWTEPTMGAKEPCAE